MLDRTYVGPHVPRSENYRTHYGRSLDLQRIDYSIRTANLGYMLPMTDLGRETISLDGHCSALLQKRLNRVAALDWTVEAAKGEGVDKGRAEEYATFVRHHLELLPNFRERIMDLAWGTFDGRAASEIGWRADGRFYRPDDLYWIHPRRLSFGPNRDLRIVDSMRAGTGFQPDVGFPLEQCAYKFVRYTPRIFGDYQEREGLLPRVLYWSFFVRFGTRERMMLLELFGKPWRIVMPKGDPSFLHNQATLDSAFDAMNALGSQSTARLPPGMEVMIAQPQKGAGDVHDQAIDHAMKVLSKLILGATGTTDAVSTGLGSSIGNAHVSEEDLIIASDARRLAEALESGLTDAMIAVNFGPSQLTHAPRFILRTDPPLDREQEGNRIGKALEVGLDIALEEARDKLGFRAVEPDEPVLRRVQRQAPPGQLAPPPGNEIVYPVGTAPAPGEISDSPFVALNLPGGADNDNGDPPLPPSLPPAPGSPPAGGGAPPPALPPGLPSNDNGSEFSSDSTDPAVEALAQKMTELGLTRCEHGRPNRCPLCGIERVRDVDLDDSGEPVWSVQWRPIPSASSRETLAGKCAWIALLASRVPLAASDVERLRDASVEELRAVVEAAGPGQEPANDRAPHRAPITASEPADVDEALNRAIESPEPGSLRLTADPPSPRDEYSCTVCLAAQPETVFGSPDTSVDRGVSTMSKATAALAAEIVQAVGGKTDPKAIRAAIERTAKRFSDDKLAEPVRRELLQTGMLGALDSAFEIEEETTIAPETFRALIDKDRRFAARPLHEAIAQFLKRKVVTRAEFDSLEDAAKRRAFTVANAANREMVRTVKRELIRQVALGADFADFGKAAAKRFEQAGWTPANASHVETIFRTNVLNAYNGGRVRQMSQPEIVDVRPYWQIMTVNDGPPRQRRAHQAVHGFVLVANDPFWQTAAPPFGYNCRCRLRSLSPRQLSRGSARLVEGSRIRGLPDPGFTSGRGVLL